MKTIVLKSMSGINGETLLITAVNVDNLFELSQRHKCIQSTFVTQKKIIETSKLMVKHECNMCTQENSVL